MSHSIQHGHWGKPMGDNIGARCNLEHDQLYLVLSNQVYNI